MQAWTQPRDIEHGGVSFLALCVCLNGAGSLLATASLDATVRVWRVSDGSCVQTLEGPGDGVEWVTWHPKGDVVLAGSEDFTLWMWLAQSGNCMQVGGGGASRPVALCIVVRGTVFRGTAGGFACIVARCRQRMWGSPSVQHSMLAAGASASLAFYGGGGRLLHGIILAVSWLGPCWIINLSLDVTLLGVVLRDVP